jgi:hypothetical protein
MFQNILPNNYSKSAEESDLFHHKITSVAIGLRINTWTSAPVPVYCEIKNKNSKVDIKCIAHWGMNTTTVGVKQIRKDGNLVNENYSRILSSQLTSKPMRN